jgi:hypothetical protein
MRQYVFGPTVVSQAVITFTHRSVQCAFYLDKNNRHSFLVELEPLPYLFLNYAVYLANLLNFLLYFPDTRKEQFSEEITPFSLTS